MKILTHKELQTKIQELSKLINVNKTLKEALTRVEVFYLHNNLIMPPDRNSLVIEHVIKAKELIDNNIWSLILENRDMLIDDIMQLPEYIKIKNKIQKLINN